MSFKILQTAAVLGLAALSIACILSGCWAVGVSLSGVGAWIGCQDGDEDCEK